MGPFSGRGDNMVKLRGVNVWPEALGEIVTAHERITEDYFVRAVRADNRDEMIVCVTTSEPAHTYAGLQSELEELLKERIGVRFTVEVSAPGSLDALTEISTSPKPKRFRDERS
jgi:phenylacetate-CoA ligase